MFPEDSFSNFLNIQHKKSEDHLFAFKFQKAVN